MPDIDASRRKISFSSIGNTPQEITERTTFNAPLSTPFALKYPLRISEENSAFDMHDSIHDAIADNLHHLILTNHGERVANYFFGANLGPLLLEAQALGEAFSHEVGSRIQSAVKRTMPYVKLNDFSTEFDRSPPREVKKFIIKITYTVPSLNSKIRGKEIIMHVGA